MSIKEKKIIKVLILILFILVGIISFNYQCEICYLVNSNKNISNETKEIKEEEIKEEVPEKRLTLKEKIEEAKKMMTITTREEDKDEVELFIRC